VWWRFGGGRIEGGFVLEVFEGRDKLGSLLATTCAMRQSERTA
jgi:hypothetical protein